MGKTWPDPERAGRTGYEAAPAVRCLTVVGPAWGESVERIPPREESLTKKEGKLIHFIQLSALQKKMCQKKFYDFKDIFKKHLEDEIFFEMLSAQVVT